MYIMDARGVRNEGLDKFYTSERFAKKCVDFLFERFPTARFDLVVEPSAGNGSFVRQLPNAANIEAIDIAPEDPSVRKEDFFRFRPSTAYSRVLVVGNPPFGKGCSLAIRFFNHAAEWADAIAFIVPRTFRRRSVQNKLSLDFHLVDDMEVPVRPCVFHPAMSVKCCFQIWERRAEPRAPVRTPTSHPHWEFLKYGALDDRGQPTPPAGADFAIRAYGGHIGEIRRGSLHTLRPKSWHWIRAIENPSVLIERFSSLDFSEAENTARQNSMGRAELVLLYQTYLSL